MKCKKLIAMGMAVVMVLALGVPALAENTVITGMYDEIKIDVDIPQTGTAVINPYEMPVKAKYVPASGEPEDVAALTTAGKIATQPLIGVSTCEVALDVGATVTATAQGSMLLSTKDLTGAKTKSAVVYLECKQDTTLTKDDVTDTAASKPISGIAGQKAVDAFNDWPASTYNFNTGDDADKANSDKVLAGLTSTTKLGLCTLAAGKDDSGTMKPQPGSFLLARLGGDVVQNPVTPWTSEDGVIVNVAFTFTPAAPKEGKELTKTAIEAGATVLLGAGLPDGVPANGTAKYSWEIVDAGSAGAKITSGGNTANCSIIDAKGDATTLTAGVKFKVKCTVWDDSGIKYVTEEEITIEAASS